MISEHARLEACLSDLAKKGRPAGAKTRPMPPQEGPRWLAFVEWFAAAPVANRRADLWRAFCAGAQSTVSTTISSREEDR